VVYLRFPHITSSFDLLDWFPEKCYWSWLNEAPSVTRKDDRCGLRNINFDSPFTQIPLKVIEVLLHVADKQRRFAGHVYDGHVVCVES
jgi:hypothetical protein